MSSVRQKFENRSTKARSERAQMFRGSFVLGSETTILDLGSENGAAINATLSGTAVCPENVYIADISREQVEEGERRYGFRPVVIGESDRLPFKDNSFDVVHCSSVIEHVTLPKGEIWRERSGRRFRRVARERQVSFAREIERIGKGYYVQSPNRFFPIESHSWLPFLGYFPRPVQLLVLRASNRWWVKSTQPDWHLLSPGDMSKLFPRAEIRMEMYLGMCKSTVAVGHWT